MQPRDAVGSCWAQELAKKFPAGNQTAAITAGDRLQSRSPSCCPALVHGHVNLGAGQPGPVRHTCGLHFWPTELSGWQAAWAAPDSLPADMMDLSAGQTGILGASLSADLGAVLHELLHWPGAGPHPFGSDGPRLRPAAPSSGVSRSQTRPAPPARSLSRRPAPKPLYWFGQVTFLDPATAPGLIKLQPHQLQPHQLSATPQITCRISALARPAPQSSAIIPGLTVIGFWQTDDNSKIDCDEEGPADRVSISDGHVISVGSSLCCIEIRSLEP
uniref:PepX_C domain-containing protein n=1 Tax=Macrostomum lignano TaxID=282301 RepID=A0A1I8F6V0_9PLAT